MKSGPPCRSVGLAMLIAACGEPVHDGDDAVVPLSTRTRDYAITALTIGVRKNAGQTYPSTHTQGMPGFNLDGLFSSSADAMRRGSPDCAHEDFFSTLDPDQNAGTCAAGSVRGGNDCRGGVDNQFSALGSLVQGTTGSLGVVGLLSDRVRTGRLAMLVRVQDVDGAPGPGLNDDHVTVLVYAVARPMFASCSMIGVRGNRYAVDDASLDTPGDLSSARLRFEARIVNGRIVAMPPTSDGPSNFSLSFPYMNGEIPLEFYSTRLRFDVAVGSSANGNLGGYVRPSQLASAIGPLLLPSSSMSTIYAVLMGLVDVRLPAEHPSGCATPNGGIGLGLGFTTVPATIASTTVRGASPGMCGSL